MEARLSFACMPSKNQEQLFQTAVEELLVKGKYPSKADIFENKEHFDVVMPMLRKLLFFSIADLSSKLRTMGYTQELADKSAIDIAGKVNVFFNWQLLMEDVFNWLPVGFLKLEHEEREALMPAILGIINAYVQPAYMAYASDQILDNAVENSEQMGGYRKTANGEMLYQAGDYLLALDSQKPETLAGYEDQFKVKLVQLVNCYIDIFNTHGTDFQDQPDEIIALLDQKGLAGFYQMYEYVALFVKAWMRDITLDDDADTTHEKFILMTEAAYEAVLPLADVLNYELISSIAAWRVMQGGDEAKKDTILPFTFLTAMGTREAFGGSGSFMRPAHEAYYLSLVDSQGLVMVANALYARQAYTMTVREDKKGIEFVRNPNKKRATFRELLSANNKKLFSFIEIAELAVRLSDDFGDLEDDAQNNSANLLLLKKEYRPGFLDGCSVGENETGDDVVSPQSLDDTMKMSIAKIRDMFADPEDDEDEDTQKISPEKIEAALALEEVPKAEVMYQAGYLGELSNRSGIDVVTFMKEAYSDFDSGRQRHTLLIRGLKSY
jgi:hypothetical protein